MANGKDDILDLKASLKQNWKNKYVSSFNTKYPFSSIIDRWYQWDPREKNNFFVDEGVNLTWVCVDENFGKCTSETVRLTGSFREGNRTLNNQNTDYFVQLPGVFSNLRPVYKHYEIELYLFWHSGFWLVNNVNNVAGGYLRARDTALLPEYITTIWEIALNNAWTTFNSNQVLCKGVETTLSCNDTDFCKNDGICIQMGNYGNESSQINSTESGNLNELLCRCTNGTYGQFCDKSLNCPDNVDTENSQYIYASGLTVGSIITVYCNQGYQPVAYHGICTGTDRPSWVQNGACTTRRTTIRRYRPTYPTTKRPRSTYPYWMQTTPNPPWTLNLDNVPGLYETILTIIIIFQIFVHICHWLILVSSAANQDTKIAKYTDNNDEPNVYRMSVLGGDSSNETPGSNAGTSKVPENTIDTETGKKKTQKTTEPSYVRILSVHMFMSAILWGFFISGCVATKCLQYGPNLFYTLLLIAGIVIACAYFIILLESFRSRERGYIRNILNDRSVNSYLDELKQIEPTINFVIECYHYKTRTQSYTYTDAQGNLQHAIRTYTELVVTHTAKESFQFRRWEDCSDQKLEGVDPHGMTRLKLDKEILFGDSDTAEAYTKQRDSFIERNEDMDIFYNFYTNENIEGFEKRLTAYVDLHYKPWWVKERFYWLSTVFGFSWPYRWLFRYKTSKTHYQVRKKVFAS